jgi:hypothetical protein
VQGFDFNALKEQMLERKLKPLLALDNKNKNFKTIEVRYRIT